MAEMQKVSWRTVCYAALGTAAVIAATIGIVHSDGVRPTSLKSSAATRWLVYRPQHLLVLADGLSGHVLAKIDADPNSDATGEFALQGAAGAFLISPSQGSVRAISTANLQLGTPQLVGSLTDDIDRHAIGVGSNGLTVVNPKVPEANIVAAGDVTRTITVPKSKSALVARDGSVWTFTQTDATHISFDNSSERFALRGAVDDSTTLGPRGVTLDRTNRTLHWLGAGDVSLASIPNVADAVLQLKGDDAPCLWLGADDTLACVGATGVDKKLTVAGLNLGVNDRLAVSGSVAAVVRGDDNTVQRIDLDTPRLLTTGNPQGVPTNRTPTVIATGGMIWIDDEAGSSAWVINPFGSEVIHKDDTSAPTVDAQGLVTDPGSGPVPDPNAAGNAPGNDTEIDHLDGNGVDDPPTAVDDSVTARAGDTITIPVTANDWDPDGDAIALQSVGDEAVHGTANVLDGTSVTYVPDLGYSGTDEFEYTIVDEHGNTDSATVHLRLFPADSPNRPPIATPNRVTTRVGHAVVIDVLANDIDPERDTLKIATFTQSDGATITDATGPSGLPALKYEPPPTPNIYKFTYQAADPQGGVSEKTPVTVEVLGPNAENQPPEPKTDAIRLSVGKSASIDVLANDIDPDGDELMITGSRPAPGIDTAVRGQRLDITMKPGAEPLSVVHYTVSDQTGLDRHAVEVAVLVVKIDENAPNQRPVANADTDRVVVGNSVKIPVTANDNDPEHDPITVIDVTQPADGKGTTAKEGNFVRFTPNLPDVTEPTPVAFTYKIGDGHGNVAVGNVTVTVLAEPLPRAPSARDDFADTFTDQPVIVDVLTNDTDPSGGTPGIVGEPVCTNDGTASVTSDQRVTFVPPAGQNGIFRCKYSVGNGQGLASAWIIVTVTDPPAGNHDPQIIDSQLQQSVDIGETLTLSAGTLATDIDSSDSLFFASVSLSTPGIGSISWTAKSPTLTYIAPLKSSSEIPNVVSVDITVSDGHDGYDQGTISISINNPTTAPKIPVAPPITRSTRLDVPVPPIDVIAETRDANPGDTLTLVSASRDASSANATVNATPATGIVQITPQEVGVVTVTYVVQNLDKQTAIGKITVTVTEAPPVNLAPVATTDDLIVSSGGSGSVEVMRNDLNIADIGDNPSVTLVNKPPASFGTVSLVNGILTLVAAPDVVEKHATINYLLSDGVNASVQGDIRLAILACGESPPAVRSATLFTPYMTPINIDLGQYVDSGHIVPGSINGAGLTGPTGTYTPPEFMNDSVTVTYTVANGCGQSAQGVLTIDVNRAPVANSVSRELSAGTSLTLAALDLASDDEKLTIQSLAGNPAWVSLVAGADGPIVAADPPAGTHSGAYGFTATIADPGGLSAVVTINLTITNLPPTAVADAYYTDTNLFAFDPTQNDFDTEAGPLTVTLITPSDHVVGRTGNLITVSLDHGVNKFDYTISDSGGLTSSSTVTITSNREPTVGDFEGTTSDPSIDVPLEPFDPDGDSLSVTCNADPVYFDVQITSDPEPGFPEARNLHVMLTQPGGISTVFFCKFTDPFGAQASARVSLTFT